METLVASEVMNRRIDSGVASSELTRKWGKSRGPSALTLRWVNPARGRVDGALSQFNVRVS